MTGREDLAAAARLFGRLLLHELDAATVRELQQPDIAAALRALGVEPPDEPALPQLGADYFRCLLQPAGAAPPVHSLWRDGRYQGEPAVAVQRIAQTAGFQLGAAARNQPPDHLGCILLLWAELAEPLPDLADLLVAEHLGAGPSGWTALALAPAMRDGGFYGAVARATSGLIDELRSVQQEAASSPPPAEN